MTQVPWPLSNSPGLRPQEGAGKLTNVFPEPRGEGAGVVWRRAPGAIVFSRNPSSGSASMEFNANARTETLYSTFFALVGSSTTTNAGSSVNSITYPTGTAANDVVFLASAGDSTVANPTTPTGFTLIGSSVSFMMNSLMYKVCTGESTVALTWGSTLPWVTLAFSIRGADTTTPVVDTATASTGASGDPIPPNFTATTADCLMVNVSFVDDDAASAVVAPTTITIAAASTFGMGGNLFAVTTGTTGTDAASVMVGLRSLATTGAITASTWAVTDGDDEWASISFTLRHD